MNDLELQRLADRAEAWTASSACNASDKGPKVNDCLVERPDYQGEYRRQREVRWATR